MARYVFLFWAVLLWAFAGYSTSFAVDFYVQAPNPQPNSDYEVKLLRIALDHMPGDHNIFYVDTPHSQGRSFRELASGSAAINVLYSGYSREREATTRMVYVPLTRGLLGHRMFIMHKEALPSLQGITTVDQLARRITVGIGTTRPGEIILPAAGFSIVRSPSHQLIPMLLRGRFTGLFYGLDEVDILLQEITSQTGGADMVLNTNFVLAYPFDSFFFTAPGDTIRAQLIEQGLKNAYASGAFMQHFESFPPIQAGLALMQRHEPKLFTIENPDLSDAVKAIPAEYWHNFKNESDDAR